MGGAERDVAISGRSVLVLGLGVSGRSAARFCAERGARVTAADARDAAALGPLDLPASVRLALGGPGPDPADFDWVVPSPGVPPERYAGRAREVLGDVELAWRCLRVPVVAVTGTNGKSTTTCLVEALLRAAGLRAEAAGNLGRPALELVGRPLDVAVLEVSSFQLEAVATFQPRVAVILNLAADHLDRHGDFDAYRDAKARILARQTPEDAAVLNDADPAVAALSQRTRARVLRFRAGAPPAERGAGRAWSDAGAVRLEHGDDAWRLPLDGVAARATGPVDNVLAALLATAALGADPERAARALADFRPLPHRGETVADADGVLWVDDSKATNPHAAARALAASERPVVWIAGGRDKGLDFAALAGTAAPRVREAILIGEAATALAGVLAPRTPCHQAVTLDAAVARAARVARPGDVVLLAPACASQDQFRDYADRGLRFREAVDRVVDAGPEPAREAAGNGRRER